METKTCKACGETKPRSEFGRVKGCRGGIDTTCKPCRNAQSRARYSEGRYHNCTATCERCGAQFRHTGRAQRRYCSRECGGKARGAEAARAASERTVKVCPSCNESKPVDVFPWANKAKGRRKSRCRGCQARARREASAGGGAGTVLLTCDHCAQSFRRPPSGVGPYCSAECHAAAKAPEEPAPGHWTCKACGATKPEGAFYRQSNGRVRGSCKACVLRRQRERRRLDPARRERKRAEYNRNRERYRRAARRYYLANKRECVERARAYRVRRHEAAGEATPADIAARVAYYGGRCWMCGGEYEAVDHVKPLAKGGSDWPANLRPACRACNAAKRDAWPMEAVVARVHAL